MTAASNSEGRKRAQEAASASRVALGATNGPDGHSRPPEVPNGSQGNDLDAIRVAGYYSARATALEAERDEARAEVERLTGWIREWQAATGCPMPSDAEARAAALEATLSEVRALHTRDRERLVKVEALLADMDCEWGEGRACHGPTCCRRAALRVALATTSEEAER